MAFSDPPPAMHVARQKSQNERINELYAMVAALRAVTVESLDQIAKDTNELARQETQAKESHDNLVAMVDRRLSKLESSRDRLSSLESPAFEKWMAGIDARLMDLERQITEVHSAAAPELPARPLVGDGEVAWRNYARKLENLLP